MATGVLTNGRLATLSGDDGYRLIPSGAIAIASGRIRYCGPSAELPVQFRGAQTIPLDGRLVTPGLIDCHTHLVHAGSRANEFEQRQLGASYEDIAGAGGGIASTVAATRAASEAELLAASQARLDRMLTQGVTTIEIKSGYGLDRDTELKMLRCARALGQTRGVSIRTTFLGAHAIPSGMNADAYLDNICLPTLRAAAAAGLVDAVDGYCERIAFNPTQIERLFDAARTLGLPVKLHAEQLSNLGASALAARFGALSVDHLEYLDEAGVAAIAASGTVAVLLPGAFYALRETKKPPIDLLRKAGVPLAIATDCNPGTSPMTSILLAMNMAATLFGLTPEECLRGVTQNAARALGLSDRGTLAPGMRADLAVWDVDDPAELSYRIGDAPLHARFVEGAQC